MKLLINCPKCNSENTNVSAEVITTDSIRFDWKGKGLGVKKKKYKTIRKPTEVRVFYRCDNCGYDTDNLNGHDSIEGHEVESNLIVKQVADSIYPNKALKTLENKFKKFLSTNPSKDDIEPYFEKYVITPDNAKLFLKLVKEHYSSEL